jgi:hypothetical protein
MRTDLYCTDLPGGGIPIVFIHGLGGAATLEYAQVAANDMLTGRRRMLVERNRVTPSYWLRPMRKTTRGRPRWHCRGRWRCIVKPDR